MSRPRHRDPNMRRYVEGREALARYLRKPRDLVVLRGDAPNEVYFDRAVRAPLVVPPAA